MRIPETPPPGPFRPGFWRSPLRGPWLASFLGVLLLPLLTVVALTGWISHNAYRPDLGHNLPYASGGDFLPLVHLPEGSPSWIYALTQGLHVNVGLVAIPLVLAKLWSVIPRLFTWPPARSTVTAAERLSSLLLVGSILFELATGVLNIEVYYAWHFNFVRAHYYGAWVFVASLAVHVAIKLSTVRSAFRTRGALRPLRDGLADTEPEPYEDGGLVSPRPAEPTMSRRALVAAAAGGSLALLLVNVGESVGGPLRRFALLAPRGRVYGTGPNAFPINRTAEASGVSVLAADPGWRLQVTGARTVIVSRGGLLEMAQHTESLPIACVEGWSTTQSWTGVRLADLARLCGVNGPATLTVSSFQVHGPFRQATFGADQVADPRSLLALRVGGVDISLDHGYPARVVVPGAPGVHCTKWVGTMIFTELA